MSTWHRMLALAALVLTAGGCAPQDNGDEDVKVAAPVATIVAETADVSEILTAYGASNIAPFGEQTLSATIEATVTKVLVAPGAEVKAGQALIDLKPSTATAAALSKSLADRDAATQAYGRAQRLRGGGLDSDGDVEQAKATLTAAAAAYRAAGGDQDAFVVRAASAGIVETLSASPGDVVAAGTSLGKVGNLAALRVKLGVETSDIPRLKPGDPITLRTSAGALLGVGIVASIDPLVDPQTGLAAVTATAPGLPVGQAVRGDIALRTVHAVTVPKAALVYNQDQPNVFVVAGGVAHRRAVLLGPTENDVVAVVDGLNNGERVVSDGAAGLDDGTAVSDASAAPHSASGAADANP